MGAPIQGWAVRFTGEEVVRMADARLAALNAMEESRALWQRAGDAATSPLGVQIDGERRLLHAFVLRTESTESYLLTPADLRALSLDPGVLDAGS